jgi:hypothetical protein
MYHNLHNLQDEIYGHKQRTPYKQALLQLPQVFYSNSIKAFIHIPYRGCSKWEENQTSLFL